jgi:hypothetical protein
MPDFTFTFTVRGIGAQRAQAIQDRLTQRLSDDQIEAQSSALVRITAPYRVVGVDTDTRQVFDETVDAVSEQDAKDQVTAADASRVVALVRAGP